MIIKFVSFNIFSDNYNLTTESTESTELASGLLSVSSVLSVVYYLSLVGICILLVNIVWFLTTISCNFKKMEISDRIDRI
jgi:hypothetical protein